MRILRKLGIIRMYRLVFFIFCKHDCEMLRLWKKTTEFLHAVLQRNVTAENNVVYQTENATIQKETLINN